MSVDNDWEYKANHWEFEAKRRIVEVNNLKTEILRLEGKISALMSIPDRSEEIYRVGFVDGEKHAQECADVEIKRKIMNERLTERTRCADLVYLAAMDGKTALQAWRIITPDEPVDVASLYEEGDR